MPQQKQWLLEHSDLGNIQVALHREVRRLEDVAPHLVSQIRQLNELIEKVAAVMAATGRVYKEDDAGDDGAITERLLLTLIPMLEPSEPWNDPYTVIPVGKKWAVVYKETVERPVGEKLYSQSTHAYRACRRLNAAYWENGLDSKDVEEAIAALLAKLPEGYPQAKFGKEESGYWLMVGYTTVFRDASLSEALKETRDYVEEREKHPDLPVGVVHGIYD